VAENLLVYGRYFGLPPREVPGAHRAAARVRRPHAPEGAKINTLSGGMKRRLTLARALVNDPQVLFLTSPPPASTRRRAT
jgi:lipooligosaccharide transport system ATP-binding protein